MSVDRFREMLLEFHDEKGAVDAVRSPPSEWVGLCFVTLTLPTLSR
jgi:hypothetical protein